MAANGLWTDPRFPGVAARRATPDDLPALKSLRSRFEDDYLPEVLDEWVHDSPGGVYVYFCDGAVCGLVGIHFPRPGQAWLRGKRIAIGFEGRGIGTATALFEIEEAERLGARVVRLLTAVDNAAVHRMMERVGMSPAGRWRVAWPEPRPAAAAGAPDLLIPDEDGTAAARLLLAGQTPPFAPTASDPYTLFELDEAAVADLVSRGAVAVADGRGEPEAAAVLTGDDATLVLGRLAGDPERAAGIAAWAAGRAAALGRRLCISLPEAEAGVALEALGVPADAGDLFVVYERRLAPVPAEAGPA